MKKKISMIIIGIILVIIILFGISFIKKNQKSNKTENLNNHSVIYDKNGNVIYDNSKKDEVTEIIEDTVIQGIVELHHNGYIYIFNGQHFGEFGFEMNEYTRTNIVDKKQKCIDYITLKEYDTDYIEEGDLLICTGNLSKKGYGMGENNFDTKDNSIIVLKSSDYNNMKLEVLQGKNTYLSSITIGESYTESGYLYLKYNLENDIHSDTGYKFPFAIKAYITDNTKIIGKLEDGKTVKVQYEDLTNSSSELTLKSIEVIEN